MEIDGVGKIESGMDNGVAWDKNPMLGPRIKNWRGKGPGAARRDLQRVVHWRELYPKVETTGTETVDGELCYKVVLTPKEGNPETTYFRKNPDWR